MADIPVIGIGTEPEVIGEGTGGAVTPATVPLVCLYISTVEELIQFVGERPAVGEPDPEEEEPVEGGSGPSLTTTTYAVDDGGGPITMTFSRGNPRQNRTVQFNITTEPGTALPNVNYLEPTSPLTFPGGETVIQSALTILNDQLITGMSKSFKIRISPPASRLLYTRGPISFATVTINGVSA